MQEALTTAEPKSLTASAASALTVQHVMCVRLGALGDIVFALHALRLLRTERPDIKVSWLVEQRFADLLRGHPDIDHLHIVPRRRWRELLAPSLNWKSLSGEVREFLRTMRHLDVEATIDFHGNLRSGLLVRAVAAPLRIGHDRALSKEYNYVFQNVRVTADAEPVHRIQRDLNLLAPLGIAPRYVRPRLHVGESDRRSISERLVPLRRPERRLVIIHPGVSKFGAIKQWSLPGFAEVADRLIAQAGCDVLLSCGPGEEETVQHVLGLMRQEAQAAPKTENIPQLVALLEHADLLIACDTGPLHIAAALGRPIIGLYGPKDPAIYGPIGTRGRLVRVDLDCSPCTRRRCRHLTCMKQIQPEEVSEAAMAVLRGGGERFLLA